MVLVFMSTLGLRVDPLMGLLQSLISVGEAIVDNQQCGLWICDVYSIAFLLVGGALSG